MRRWLPYAISLSLHIALGLTAYQVKGTTVSTQVIAIKDTIAMPQIAVAHHYSQTTDDFIPDSSEPDDDPFETPELDEPQKIHKVQKPQNKRHIQAQAIKIAKRNEDDHRKEEALDKGQNLEINPQNTPTPKVQAGQGTQHPEPNIDIAAVQVPKQGLPNTNRQTAYPVNPKKTAKTNAAMAKPMDDDTALWNAYVKVLNHHFNAKKFYPDMARKLGHRGTVWVTLKLSRSGTLLSAQIETSSGSRLLDKAALKAAQMAIPAPPFPAKTREDNRIIRIPYRYL